MKFSILVSDELGSVRPRGRELSEFSKCEDDVQILISTHGFPKHPATVSFCTDYRCIYIYIYIYIYILG